ncbi:hypothetical protein [Rhizobium sp. BK176]|uniref:hypothetical protein n=1 Tax=Rhizobium sp. BK176 TaxID=2587071 RepID=UPI0021682315|nr:hypothetical protein [Rhizobium sp. BK176]MCS4089527.1 hypothetical protein [Rhizobium sp. BK176]
MPELQLTHAFVRSLTKGIREAYGRDELRQSDVLKIVAKAAGREPGPMMHALKTAAKAEIAEVDETPKNQFCSFGLTVKLLGACQSNSMRQIQMIADMLAPDTAFAKLALALANYRKSDHWAAEFFLVEALMEDRMWLELVASEIGACKYPAAELHAFGSEQYGETWSAELLGGSIIPSDFRVWAAHAAIYAGLLRFVGDRAVFPQADTSEDSHIDKLRKRMMK